VHKVSIKFRPIFHVGYAMPDMDKALDNWARVMGVGPFFVERHVTGNDEEYGRRLERPRAESLLNRRCIKRCMMGRS
jgi:hypothetical protein